MSRAPGAGRWIRAYSGSLVFHAMLASLLLWMVQWKKSHSEWVMNIDLSNSSLLLRPAGATGHRGGGEPEAWYEGARIVPRPAAVPKLKPVAASKDEPIAAPCPEPCPEKGGDWLPAAALSRPPRWVAGLITENDYPREATLRNQQGRVKAEVSIDADGTVRAVKIVQSSYPALDQLVLEKLQHARFQPGLDQNGNPVPVRMLIPIDFELH